MVAGRAPGRLDRRISRSGAGFGCLGNTVIGVVGAFLGGLIFTAIGITGTAGFLGSVAVATLGAVIVIAIAHLGRR